MDTDTQNALNWIIANYHQGGLNQAIYNAAGSWDFKVEDMVELLLTRHIKVDRAQLAREYNI